MSSVFSYWSKRSNDERELGSTKLELGRLDFVDVVTIITRFALCNLISSFPMKQMRTIEQYLLQAGAPLPFIDSSSMKMCIHIPSLILSYPTPLLGLVQVSLNLYKASWKVNKHKVYTTHRAEKYTTSYIYTQGRKSIQPSLAWRPSSIAWGMRRDTTESSAGSRDKSESMLSTIHRPENLVDGER